MEGYLLMSKASAVGLESLLFDGNVLVSPEAAGLYWISKDPASNVKAYVSLHEVAASASDAAIAVDEDSNTQLTILWDNEGTGASDLTVKTNSDSDGRAVQPIRILSGALSALTVSNSDASNAKDLGICRIVVSDTTNTVLKEVEG